MLFTLALLLLDGVMWGLLYSADSALLLGTSVLVVALAGMMFVTKYRLVCVFTAENESQ
ncbi:inner membrane CreD family protein [Escherichia coli]